MIHFHLLIYDDWAPSRRRVIHSFEKQLGSPLLNVGETFELWEDGPEQRISARWLSHDGAVNVELQSAWISDNRKPRDAKTDNAMADSDPYYWPVEFEKEDVEHLRKAGWVES